MSDNITEGPFKPHKMETPFRHQQPPSTAWFRDMAALEAMKLIVAKIHLPFNKSDADAVGRQATDIADALVNHLYPIVTVDTSKLSEDVLGNMDLYHRSK